MSIRFILISTLFFAWACVCLSTTNEWVVSAFTTVFILTMTILLAVSVFSKSNLFLAGFSFVGLVFFTLDYQIPALGRSNEVSLYASKSLSYRLAEFYQELGRPIEPVAIPPYTENVTSSYTVQVPIVPLKEAAVFSPILAITAGLIGGFICQWFGPKPQTDRVGESTR